MRLVPILLAFAIQAAGPAQAPPLPYEDHGACPFECCIYRDWTAETKLTAYDWHHAVPPRKPAFTILRGERVTAMTGLVRTTVAGEAVVTKPVALEVSTPRFPKRPLEKLPLAPGARVFLLTNQGEGWMTGWYDGRLLESFDASRFTSPEDCGRSQRCTGIIERWPEREWWVKVRNSRGKIGWVLMPPDRSAFNGTSGCS